MIRWFAAAFALLLAATGPAAAQWADSPAIKSLYEAAKAEGEVILWAPQMREVAWIPRAFAQMFPGVTVKPLGDGDVVNRMMLDLRSSRYEVDVLWHGLPAVAPLMRRDYVATVDWAPFGISGDNVAFDGRMAFTNNSVYVVAYNSAVVKESEIATSWADLLDDRFRGRMVASLFQLPQAISALAQDWGNDRTIQYARDLLTRSQILITRAPREGFLKADERPIAVAELDTLPRLWVADGLAIGYRVLEPVVAHQYGVLVVSGAPHPNAGRLLAGWLASREGKRARERASGEIDYRPGSENELARRLQASGAKFIYDSVEQAQDRETLAQRLTFLLSLQPR